MASNANANNCTDATKIYRSASTSVLGTISNLPSTDYKQEGMLFYLPFGSIYGKQVFYGKAGTNWESWERVLNGSNAWSSWARVSGNKIGNNYSTFSGSVATLYDDYKDLNITTNLKPGIYVLLLHTDSSQSGTVNLLYLAGMPGGRVISAPIFRGIASSGGGTAGWALVEALDTTNSLTFTTYGYFNASQTQRFYVAAIQLI